MSQPRVGNYATPIPKRNSDEVTGIFLLALVSLLGALQFLVLQYVFPFLPGPTCVLAALLIQSFLLYFFRRRLKEDSWHPQLMAFAGLSGFWIFIQFFAVFKMVVIGNSLWARSLLYTALAAGVVSQIFWPAVYGAGRYLYSNDILKLAASRWGPAADMFVPGLLVLLLAVPDLGYVLGQMFFVDSFYHFDGLLMAPGWAHLKGLVLNLDAISQYSTALPIIVSEFLKHSGGFDYPQAVRFMLTVCILYYIALYFLLRVWLGSISLSAAGVFLAVKLQLFHLAVSPLVWIFPSTTPLRFLPDLLFLFCVLKHVRTKKALWLLSAAVAAGISLAWMVDVGMYLLAALLIYCAAFAFEGGFLMSWPFAGMLGLCSGVPLAVGLLLLWCLQGPAVFLPQFWHNAFEFAGLFLQGWGALPMTEGLLQKHYFAFFMGFLIPIIYTWTLVAVGTLCILRRIKREDIFVMVLCVYGLGLYHYFIHRSGVTSYDCVSVPLVMVLCFGFSRMSDLLEGKLARVLKLFLVLAVLGALVTGQWFTQYPHIVNLGRFDWSAQKRSYERDFDFAKDARLIRSLTGPDERVALVSSFDVKMLMQADRKPFFYFFALVPSAQMRSDSFRGTLIHTVDRMERVMGQLRDGRPLFIFVESKLVSGPQAAAFLAQSPATREILEYVRGNYAVYGRGEYLLAFKRKP